MDDNPTASDAPPSNRTSPDRESDRLTGRVQRYAGVGAAVGGLAMQMAANRVFGRSSNRGQRAADLSAALGKRNGQLMNVATQNTTTPDALPA